MRETLKRIKQYAAGMALAAALCLSAGCGAQQTAAEAVKTPPSVQTADAAETDAPADDEKAERIAEKTASVSEDGTYTSKEEVALYLHIYGKLPANYITKRDAEALGWDSGKGNLWEVAPGMSIGGSRFGNYEGALPAQEDRRYYECDVGYAGGYRGAERIIYSNDGLIFYTEDHYRTFEQLY